MDKFKSCMMIFFLLFLIDINISYGASYLGQPLPELNVKTLDGEMINLGDVTRGKATILNFTATWCFDCKTLSGYFEDLAPVLKDKAVNIYFIYVGQRSKQVKRAREKSDCEFLPEALVDERREASEAMGVISIPHMVMLNPQGIISYEGITLDEEKLKEIISELLEAQDLGNIKKD